MEDEQLLSGDDLARPAKHLPLKVIRELGRKLHRQLPTSGNWETLAEDLGYCFEEIHQFSSLASMRQETTPGETILLDWVQRGNNCTLFVLRSALINADRQDCVEYLEQEVYAKVICMDLLVCIKDELSKETEHISIRTRSDDCLIDSLRHSLQEPIRDNYVLLDRNASWLNTLAREFKGRELMLLKQSSEVQMEQDPTVDSSNPSLGTPWSDCTKTLGESDTNFPDPSFIYQRNLSVNHEQCRTNDLNLVKQFGRSQNIPVNIIEDLDASANAESSNYAIDKNVSQYSDEFNRNYPCTAPDCTILRDSTGVPSENLEQCDLNADISEYNDPSAFINDMNSDKAKFSQGKELHGVPLQDYCGQSSQYREGSNTLLCTVNDMDKERSLGANVAEYEDSSIFRPDLKIDDTPEYNYAVDVSLEREDSLTELKKVIQCESPYGNDRVHSIGMEGNIPESSQIFSESSSNQTQNLSGYAIFNGDKTSYRDLSCPLLNEIKRMTENCISKAKSIEDDSLQPQIENGIKSQKINSCQYQIFSDESLNDMEDSNYIDSDEKAIILSQEGSTSSDIQIEQYNEPGHSILDIKAPAPDGAYIDFNKYPQIPNQVSDITQRQCIRQNAHRGQRRQNRDILNNPLSTSMSPDNSGDTLKRVRFAGRCVSTVDTGHTQYEMLDRQTSCPNLEYSSSATTRASNSIDFSVIAEVFSPNMEKMHPQDMSCDMLDKNNFVSETFSCSPTVETGRHLHGKRNSFPGTDPEPTMLKDKFKFARHSLPVTRNLPGRNVPITSHTLPSVPRDSKDALQAKTSNLRRHSSQISARSGFISSDNYKTVVGGKTNRPLLDHCLANDYLFIHYNSELRGYRCWSPKETEYTVHKTLGDVKKEDGLYIFWYNRTKKNLIITVTECGELLHFRVRTKVLDKQLYHFVTHSKMFPDVQQLLEYHHDNGLYVDRDRLVYLRLPVCVKYDRIPVSV